MWVTVLLAAVSVALQVADRRRDPVAQGKDINKSAWEATFSERGLAVPAGPREDYWGTRLRPKQPDPLLGWREPETHQPGLLDIDRDGFQRYLKGAGKAWRLLILGGSVASGAYSSSIETSYFHRLGVLLSHSPEGLTTDIHVLAAGAWKSVQDLKAYAMSAGTLEPDIVVFVNGLNDLTNGGTAAALFGETTETREGEEWHYNYHAHDYEERVVLYLQNMKTAVAGTETIGADLLLVLQPALFEKKNLTRLEKKLLTGSLAPHSSMKDLEKSYDAMRRGLEKLAENPSVTFLDCSRIFDNETATTFADIWHFSDVGHEILAEKIETEVVRILKNRRARGFSPRPVLPRTDRTLD